MCEDNGEVWEISNRVERREWQCLAVKIFALPLEPKGCLLARVEAGSGEGGLKGGTDGRKQ